MVQLDPDGVLLLELPDPFPAPPIPLREGLDADELLGTLVTGPPYPAPFAVMHQLHKPIGAEVAEGCLAHEDPV